MKKLLIASITFIIILLLPIIIFWQNDLPLNHLKEKYAPVPSQFIDVNGLQAHYRIEGAGEPLLLIHGTASSLHTWDGWVERLKNDFKIIRVDLPAFGLTGPNADNCYTYQCYNDFIHDFTTAIGLDSFYMAGNSLGGSATWNYAFKYPNQVKKMILIDASGYPLDVIPASFERVSSFPINILSKYVAPKFLYKQGLTEVYYDDSKISPELVDRHYYLSLRAGNREALQYRLKENFWSHPEDIAKINTPTLILWGRHDDWLPIKLAEQFNNDLVNSRLEIVDAGHVPMEELPDETAQLALDFLQTN